MKRERATESLLVILGGVGVIAGSLLPWIEVKSILGSISTSGVDGGGDGLLTLVGGVIVLLVGLRARGQGGLELSTKLLALVAFVGLFGLIFFEYGVMADRVESVRAETDGALLVQLGSGIWVMFVGAGLACLGMLGMPRSSMTTVSPHDAPQVTELEGQGGVDAAIPGPPFQPTQPTEDGSQVSWVIAASVLVLIIAAVFFVLVNGST